MHPSEYGKKHVVPKYVDVPPNNTMKSSFIAQSYATSDNDKEKLKQLLSGSLDENQALAYASRRFPVSVKDISSVCPLDLLLQSSLYMPWMTDDAVNYRVAQLAQENKCGALGTFDFTLWHREWTNCGAVSDKVIKCIPDSEKIFLPRIVGHSSPETGHHFILWVFDFKAKQIRIYDSLMSSCRISDDDMALLRNVFRFSGGLRGWKVTYPPQWKQQDSVNCGVFVCSAAENEVFHQKVTEEALTLSQCRILRLHHATQMLKDVKAEDLGRKLQEDEGEQTDSSIHCMARQIKACLFQRVTGETRVFHDHTNQYMWILCSACKNWLHFECAGLDENWESNGFFCGCTHTADIGSMLEAVTVEDILSDEEIKDLETKMETGIVLSNRMYLWKHRGFDPALHKHYSEHFTLFNNTKTEAMIQRLETILSVPAPKQLYLTEVILPEVLIRWLQRKGKMCRYRAESVLLKGKCYTEEESAAEVTAGWSEDGNVILRAGKAAAEWCNNKSFNGRIKHVKPVVDKEGQTQTPQGSKNQEGDRNEDSPTEHHTFVYQKDDSLTELTISSSFLNLLNK